MGNRIKRTTSSVPKRIVAEEVPDEGIALEEVVYTMNPELRALINAGLDKYTKHLIVGDLYKDSENLSNDELNARIHRLWLIFNPYKASKGLDYLNGASEIKFRKHDGKVKASRFGPNRAYTVYNSEDITPIAYVDNFEDILAEAAHPYLDVVGHVSRELEREHDPKYNADHDSERPYNIFLGRYGYPDRYEGETHGQIEPVITRYYNNGTLTRKNQSFYWPISYGDNPFVENDAFVPINGILEINDSILSWSRGDILDLRNHQLLNIKPSHLHYFE